MGGEYLYGNLIQRMELSTGHGFSLGHDEDLSYHLDVSAGASFGFEDEPSLFQIPIHLNVSRWAPKIWQFGGQTGLRLDFGAINLDLLAKMGAMIGEGDTGFAVEPTIRLGFVQNSFGAEVSTVAYSQHEGVKPKTTYGGLYVNFLGIAMLIYEAAHGHDYAEYINDD